MDKEFTKLLKYCENNGLKIVFTDSRVLKDYSAMNPEAAKVMGFPDIDNNPKTKEILIDKTLPEETQINNLKHELIEMRLMNNGMEYWPAHEIALSEEKQPFDFTVPMAISMVKSENKWYKSNIFKKRKVKKFKQSNPNMGIIRG